jgi:uncharacterized radical SAM protein YgiQ
MDESVDVARMGLIPPFVCSTILEKMMRERTGVAMGDFLPANREEMVARGWDSVDVVLVTGDAYVDHPSFGVVLIGRLLEANGYRVAILSQPRYQSPDGFREFGRPRLFWGITAGNLDSIVANYTGNAKVRDRDDYSKDGNPYFGSEREKASKRRPDRATIIYSNLARAAYGDVPIILGGLEASLRRFVHYDYQQVKLRTSVLTDAKADLLVYGMGERAVIEIARRLQCGEPLSRIPGTCERIGDREWPEREAGGNMIELPSWDEIQREPSRFMAAELKIDEHARAVGGEGLVQRQQAMWVLQNPPAEPLSSDELDSLYSLPFVRAPHPMAGDVPAYRMIRHSITAVRGCFGNCSFCSITRHQGPVVTTRSHESVIEEVRRLTHCPDFGGTISDLGGPTANMYGVSCSKGSGCKRHDCLYPKVCRNLSIDESAYLGLLERVSAVQGVSHVHVSSGLRMELLLKTPRLLERLLKVHIPGAMKIAPEHTESQVLRLMHKSGPELLPRFLSACKEMSKRIGKRILFTPYLISAHPGSTLDDMLEMAAKLKGLGLQVRQFQDFTPTPGTLSTAMYVTGLDRDTLKPIHVALKGSERREQRDVLERMRPREKSSSQDGSQKGRGRRGR